MKYFLQFVNILTTMYTLNAKFIDACSVGDIETVIALINKVDPSAGNNLAIRYASVNGHVKVVKILLDDPRVDPSDYNSKALQNASINGHVEIVRLLLEDGRVDPSDNNNFDIRWAREHGHMEIVDLLTEHMYRLDGPEYNKNVIV
uniref:Uncharacterized protein n=1 Tax=viral metagenome TaxID=1070528 RepID=A0A6C0JSM1_9ZZZZ